MTVQQMTPAVSTTRLPETANTVGHLDRVAGPAQMDSSQLLVIATELVDGAQLLPGMSEPTRRVWDLIAVSPAFEAWVIGWPPGGAIELHDHGGSSGAVVVVGGELVEMAVGEDRHGALVMSRTVLSASASVSFGIAHVHEIVNLGPGPAISVHLYGPRLTAMTYYDFSDGLLEARATVRYKLGMAIP
jgi:hypothetical protein